MDLTQYVHGRPAYRRLIPRFFIFDSLYYLYIQIQYGFVIANLDNRILRSKKLFVNEVFYYRSVKSKPVFFPSRILIGAVSMSFVGEDDNCRTALDWNSARLLRIENAFPFSHVYK